MKSSQTRYLKLDGHQQDDAILVQVNKAELKELSRTSTSFGRIIAEHQAETPEGVSQLSIHSEPGWDALWIGWCCVPKLLAASPGNLTEVAIRDLLRQAEVPEIKWAYEITTPKFTRRGKQRGFDQVASDDGFPSAEAAKKAGNGALATLTTSGDARILGVNVLTESTLALYRELAAQQ